MNQSDTKQLDTEMVLPRTLGIRPLRYTDENGAQTMISGVYGGRDGSLWVATFFHEPEAQAWIIACNHFGQPVLGVRRQIAPMLEVVSDGSRKDSRSVPESESGGNGGSSGEAH